MRVKSHTIVADISPQSVQASKPPAPLFLRLKRAAAISETTYKLSGGMLIEIGGSNQELHLFVGRRTSSAVSAWD